VATWVAATSEGTQVAARVRLHLAFFTHGLEKIQYVVLQAMQCMYLRHHERVIKATQVWVELRLVQKLKLARSKYVRTFLSC
jgi:hypothetical protein